MIAFVGLGNVGSKYSRTKHNFGFWVANELAHRWNIAFRPGKGDYVYAERPPNILLAKPTFGMNHSGIPVREIVARWQVRLSDLHVIVDDVDLPLGNLRIRPRGGDGCHKGLASVIGSLSSTEFPRIRIGIGTDEQMRPAERYVLRPFRREDEPMAQAMVQRGADAVESILAGGFEKTMNEYNRVTKVESA